MIGTQTCSAGRLIDRLDSSCPQSCSKGRSIFVILHYSLSRFRGAATLVASSAASVAAGPTSIADSGKQSIQFTVPQSHTTRLLAKLDTFKTLEKGWNGYSAPGPAEVAISNAKLLVETASAEDMIPTRVEPSAMGGVGVTFLAGHREAGVEFYNNGTAHALFADNSAESMDTQPVRPHTEGYQSFLVRARRYLYGHKKAAKTPISKVPRF